MQLRFACLPDTRARASGVRALTIGQRLSWHIILRYTGRGVVVHVRFAVAETELPPPVQPRDGLLY
ncbi:hypothetical protein BHS06_32355 [Myxococcus xanthus]|nr:hypothetical protein BHS06_32355 [Myxococcus xanthus]